MSNPSYFAVIFSSQRSEGDSIGYDEMAEQMVTLAKTQKGFLGVESARGSDGFGITVSYWSSLEDIRAWKANAQHREAQDAGRSKWYRSFKTKICKIEREYHSWNEQRFIVNTTDQDEEVCLSELVANLKDKGLLK